MLQGYYSLVQYCPDWTRLEVCNIGVMLFCPERQYLDVAMTRKNARIHAIFGKKHSLAHVRTFKESFAERIRAERESLSGLDDLKKFISRRANSFLITEPRSIAVGEPEAELAELFSEIFGETPKQEKTKRESAKERLYQALERKLGKDLDQRVARRFPPIEVPVPGFHRTIRPCAGFQNGSFNIVINERLAPENSFTRMSCNLMIGRFFHETESEYWGKQRLVILAETENSSEVKKQVETFRPMMKEQDVDIYTDPGKIAATIQKEAKPLPEGVREYLRQQAPKG